LDEILRNEAGDGESHAFSEIFIHQLIETIEFVLGTVSNTASYLRLWALSLAHSQLAHVFFDKLLESFGLHGKGSFIALFLLFPVWASFTLFVLMCMDSMECFLHTLRLHWVEFQNKFYKGNGYKFLPFSFAPILEEEKNRQD
jgi:V-type H+-transporting ATPase subunit a